MNQYKHLQKNILRQHDNLIFELKQATKEGIDLEKSGRYSKVIKEIKLQKSYERTIKLVTYINSEDLHPNGLDNLWK